MNKVNGKKASFAPVREDGSRITICYGLKKLSDELYEWYEVYLPKKQTPALSLQVVKDAILNDINARTDEKILEGYEWTILHGDTEKPADKRKVGETIKVWLNRENQDNFKEAHRLATIDASKVVPVKFKLNEDESKNAIYETFETYDELNAFYLGAFAYIKQVCLDTGWEEKDNIDWAPYEALFPQPAQASNTEQ